MERGARAIEKNSRRATLQLGDLQRVISAFARALRIGSAFRYGDGARNSNVRASGDHVHSDGDAREIAVAKGAEDFLRRQAGRTLPGRFFNFLAVGLLLLFDDADEAGAVGDFLAEVIALAEYHG